MSVVATRKLQFCAGHRIYEHESKCRHLHGHNYHLFLHARAKGDDNALDALGRVIDFSVLKARFMPWIEENWDHGFIVWNEDKEAQAALKVIPDQKIFLLDRNPTAENLASYLIDVVAPALLKDDLVEISKIVLWETENCFVEVSR